MKSLRKMTEAELAAFVEERLREHGIRVVLANPTSLGHYTGDRLLNRSYNLGGRASFSQPLATADRYEYSASLSQRKGRPQA